MDKKYVNGLIVKRNENSPEFVICNLSFKGEEFSNYLANNLKNGWLNVQVKLSRGGKYYAELDDYAKNGKNTPTSDKNLKTINTTNNEITNEIDPILPQIDPSTEDINPEDIPF